MSDSIVNRVANSPIVTIDLGEYYHQGERVLLDIAPQLFQGLILREKDFRNYVAGHNWQSYLGKNVAIICSADAIVPTWAYMLLTTKLTPYANMVVFGNLEVLENALFQEAVAKLDVATLSGKPVVVKGCGELPIPVFAYVALTRILTPVVKSLMYGEPCSTVPLYKQPKKESAD